MRRNFSLTSLSFGGAVLALAGLLAGCGAIIDHVPTQIGGLPANAPPRSENPAPYPAVHDIPPSRPAAALSDDEQLRMEKELDAKRKELGSLQDPTVKDRGEAANAVSSEELAKAKAAANAGKKKPSASNSQ